MGRVLAAIYFSPLQDGEKERKEEGERGKQAGYRFIEGVRDAATMVLLSVFFLHPFISE
jgi:hypothetical protein